MGFVIAIFSWILKVLESAKNTILSVWGMVVAFLASLVASVEGLVSFFGSTNQVICSHIDSISDSVSSFFNSIPSSGGWGYFLYHILALDVAKEWVDSNNKDGLRPDSITVNLLANGEIKESKTVTKETSWKYTFEDLPKYENGVEITYTVTEDSVDYYKTIYNEENGFIINLDVYVWEQAARLAKTLSDEGIYSGPISINVSQKDIMKLDVASILERIVNEVGIPPERLHVEITESACADRQNGPRSSSKRLKSNYHIH